MTPDMWVKAVLMAIPLAIVVGRVLPPQVGWYGRIVLGGLAGLAVAVVASLLLSPGLIRYLSTFGVMAGVYAVLTLGLNVQWGGSGLLNFGIAAFFALGAFTTGLVTTAMPTGMRAQYIHQAFGLEMPFLVGVVAAGIASGVLAWVIARATLQLRLDYLAIATIGIAEIVRLIFQNERWIANGPRPLGGIPRPLFCLVQEPSCEWLPNWLTGVFAPLEPRDYAFIYLVIVALVLFVLYVVVERMSRSPWGRVLRAVREDPDSTAMSGKDVSSFKVQAFVVGAVVMGIGGALYAHYIVSIDYSHFQPLYGTFLIWVMLILGGSGNNRGAILGGLIIWLVWTGTASLADMFKPALEAIHPDLPGRSPYLRFTLIAILLELILIFRPQGILAEQKIVSKLMGSNK
mgnify:FL=1